MKKGDRVQVWDEKTASPLGWGTIVQLAIQARTKEEIPLIELDEQPGRKIWGDRCHWIPEKKAIEIGVRIFQDLKKTDPDDK